VATITVNSGPSQNSVNTGFVTVTVCAPGSTTNCQTVDNIEVDTGSYGLRLVSSALASTFTLPPETDADGNQILECTVFADGVSWGPVDTADIQISGETASSVPVQVIGDPNFSAVPAACSSRGTPDDTVAMFGANGILGVGPYVQDDGFYFTCPSGTCGETQPTLAQEVANPVASFAADNNGVIIELPGIAAGGAVTVTGALIFGIGTQSNNGLGSATIYTLDPNYGTLTITYNGTAFSSSYLDSGSNANFFVDSSIPTCSGFFCPTGTWSLTATITGVNGATNTVPFTVANATTLFDNNPSGTAFDSLAAPEGDSDTFDFGLPFFYGVTAVYTAISNASTPGGTGPYVAF
jgi:hypothetical protein